MNNPSYTLLVRGERVAVTEEVYRAYYKSYEHARYLHRQSMRHELSWERLEAAGVPVEHHIKEQTDAESEVCVAVHQAMSSLDEEMQEALWRLVLGEVTERTLAEEWGVSKTTVHKRKQKALNYLRESLAKEDVLRYNR